MEDTKTYIRAGFPPIKFKNNILSVKSKRDIKYGDNEISEQVISVLDSKKKDKTFIDISEFDDMDIVYEINENE